MMIPSVTLLFVIFALFQLIHGAVDTKIDYGTVIGIDLGTTYSCVAVLQAGRVTIIPNEQGNRITPSCVSFPTENDRLVGDAAKNQLTLNPNKTVFDVKRIIGRTFTDPSVQADKLNLPFEIRNVQDKPKIVIQFDKATEKIFEPEEISAMVLSRMKEIAENYLNTNISHAVVTVPAYFNDAQRQATKNAGKIAGLNIIRIINEPTAAAIAYGLDKNATVEKKVLVYDLGGGTLDVSLLAIENGVFEVLATNGDTHLGGEDFDQNVIDYFTETFLKKSGSNIKSNPIAVQKLRREVERAKRILSNSHSTRLEIENLIDGKDFLEVLTRARFEDLNMKLFKQTLLPIKNVLHDANVEAKDIQEVVLVGGSTRIPLIRRLVQEFFNGKKLHTRLNPDEAIAYGAAVQAAVLSGEETADILLLDVCPLTLGIQMENGMMETLIPRNTAIPTIKKDVFSTAYDYQTGVTTSIYEGERALAKDNHFLGSFELTGIAPAPKGHAQIEVTFEIDANGILKVSAEDRASKNKQHLIIQNDKNRLKPEEVERMIKESEQFKKADTLLRQKLETLNKLEHYLYTIKNYLESMDREGMDATAWNDLLQLVNENIRWVEKNRLMNLKETVDVKVIDKKYENLENTISEKLEQLRKSVEGKDQKKKKTEL